MGVAAGGCGAPAATPAAPERSRISIVREQPGAARVDGVGPIVGFARNRDCTFMHCLELVLDAVGRNIGYDELMGLSGMAFRAQFRVDAWDVGNPDPLVGDSRLEDLFAAVGWQYDVRIVRRDEIAEVDALHRAIRKSIDRGVPVLAANVMPPEDWGIITGYRRDRLWLCRAYHGGAKRMDRPAGGWPTAVVILTKRLARPASQEARAQSIRRAVEMFEKRSAGSYATGKNAFREWAQSLKGARSSEYLHANFWSYICLIDARAAAVRYLRMIAPDFASGRAHLEAAADLYDQEVRLLLSNLKDVPPEHAYPSAVAPRNVRDRQIATLEEATSLEERAIASLKKAIE
jgi:hypothetical protein